MCAGIDRSMNGLIGFTVLGAWLAAAGQGGAITADEVLLATGVKGGLVVHVECGIPSTGSEQVGGLTADLRMNASFMVHGLSTDHSTVARVREHVRSRGLSGPVSVDWWDGQGLPYVDNLVNLLVAEVLPEGGMNEVMRVLVPNGVAYIRRGETWTKTIKPWPDEIDEWTHYLHDPTNNAVAHDTVVGPPKHYQWHGTPRWSRHHESMSSTSALVSANGRLFHIFDKGSKASILLPPKWFLFARDAFNGTIFWKRPIAEWFTHLWPLKSGPAELPRRLVAAGDRVYVTLGIEAPVSALDAATGEMLRTYDGTGGTQEIILSEGTLFLSVARPASDASKPVSPTSVRGIVKLQRTTERDGAGRVVMAVDAESGRILWQDSATQVVPLTLASGAGRVFFFDGDRIVCLDTQTGERLWLSESLPRSKTFPSDYAPTLVVYKDVVLFTGGENMVPHCGAQDTMQALSIETGKLLWTAEHPPSGYQSPEDILVASGLVWTGAIAQSEDSGEFTGRDPRTGDVRKRYKPKALPTTGYGHHRCHRGKATDRFVLSGNGGINFLDVNTTQRASYGWIRGVCLYGIMPCNGLIYAPPHDCACNMDSKLYAFSAVAPESPAWQTPHEVSDDGRLQRGPAFAAIPDPGTARPDGADWPMLRHDTTRSGGTTTTVSPNLKRLWETELGGKLSSPVTADGKVFVASEEAQTVHAVELASGRVLWCYVAGGRVDSPPAIWRGLVFFGAGNGWVHCLRADDGRLVWRFRAAPEDRRIMGFERVESLWPVSGSVLVLEGEAGGVAPHDAVVTCVAGRTPYLDGGMRLLRLDARAGRKLSETLLDNAGRRNWERVSAPDILSSDGNYVYMKTLRFDLSGTLKGAPTRDIKEQMGADAHLFCPTSMLDDSWWHRSYWVYGRAFQTNATGYYNAGLMAPSGRILVFDDDTVYGFGRKAKYYRWTTPLEHTLFAAAKERSEETELAARPGKKSSIRIPVSGSFDPGAGPFSFEAWVKADTGNGVVMARGGKTAGLALLIWAGKPRLLVRNGKKLTTIAGSKAVIKRWVHLAGVITADRELQLYTNGRAVGTAKLTDFPAVSAEEHVDIGLDSGDAVGEYRGAFGFQGLMDEVRLYQGALTPDEIRQHVADPANTAASTAALAVRYSFDTDKASKGKTSGSAADTSGAERHGTTTDLRFSEGKSGPAGRFLGTRPPIRRLAFAVKHHWSQDIPMIVRGMVLANKTLFIAGPPDLVDEEKAARDLTNPEVQAALRAQDDALAGRKGALLWGVSATDGRKLSELRLDSPPTFDGMIASQGQLLFTTVDGCLVCLGRAE